MVTRLGEKQSPETPGKMVEFLIEQRLKYLYTAMPGVVVSFNAATRRARVQPAFPIIDVEDNEMRRSQIPNVPVIFPSLGGYTMHGELKAGDPVWLAYSMRGLANFKRTFEEARPSPEGGFAEHDAVAFAGFGPLEITPVSGGFGIQSIDGQRYIQVGDDAVTLQVGGATLVVSSDGITLSGGTINLNGGTVLYNGREVDTT